jgi:hypothetical protein
MPSEPADTARADITRAPWPPVLTLSAADRPIGGGGRLAATAARYASLNGAPRGAIRYPAELIAREIEDHGGDVWPAVVHFGLSYRHALRIRAGWRGRGAAR